MGWIKWSDKLPDTDTTILVSDGDDVTAAYFDVYQHLSPNCVACSDDVADIAIDINVTHWMPLPGLPETEASK